MVMFLWMFLKTLEHFLLWNHLGGNPTISQEAAFGSQVPGQKREIHLRVPCKIESQTALCLEDQPRTWIRG